jgi:hypothetical protein
MHQLLHQHKFKFLLFQDQFIMYLNYFIGYRFYHEDF